MKRFLFFPLWGQFHAKDKGLDLLRQPLILCTPNPAKPQKLVFSFYEPLGIYPI